MVVKERWVQVHRCSEALEARGLEDTLLVGIANRSTIGEEVFNRTSHGHIVVVAQGSAVNLVLPVGVGIVQHVDVFLLHAHCKAAIVKNIHALAAATLLGGDDDYTVRTTATIDSGGRCILQHVEGLNVGGVNERQSVGKTLNALVVHGHTIDNDKWVVGGVQ